MWSDVLQAAACLEEHVAAGDMEADVGDRWEVMRPQRHNPYVILSLLRALPLLAIPGFQSHGC